MSDTDLARQHEEPSNPAWLVLPRLRVQNANAISSPMTWGFPAITAFLGLMTALERRLGRDAGIALDGVGVVCHAFEPQVSAGGYTRSFALTRNPVGHDGSTSAIVEEGRAHLELTLVFQARVASPLLDAAARSDLVHRVAEQVAGMRVAGGSVLPHLADTPSGPHRRPVPELVLTPANEEAARKAFRRIARRCLPGFALVSRHDLLEARHTELQATAPGASRLDAWLDLSRWNHRAVLPTRPDGAEPPASGAAQAAEWQPDARPGWIVPIPVGFAALAPLHEPGTVGGARDPRVPFRFVESVYSIGQWLSPHRLREPAELFWFAERPDEQGLYLCANDYAVHLAQRSSASPDAQPVSSDQ